MANPENVQNLSESQIGELHAEGAGRDIRHETHHTGVSFDRVAALLERLLDKEPQRHQLTVDAIERTGDAVEAVDRHTTEAVAAAEARTAAQIDRLVDVVDRLALWAQRLTVATVGQVAVLAFAVLLMVGLLVLLASPQLLAAVAALFAFA